MVGGVARRVALAENGEDKTNKLVSLLRKTLGTVVENVHYLSGFSLKP